MEKGINPLSQWDELYAYIACMKTVVETWKSFFHTFKPDYFASGQISKFLSGIGTSISALKGRYAYDTLNKLSFIPSASGFPMRYDIRAMEMDSIKLRDKEDEDTVRSQDLKNAFVGDIFSRKMVDPVFLEKIGKKLSEEILLESDPLSLFKIRSITQVEAKNGQRSFVCTWERYGYTNVPSLYAMLFEYHSRDELSQGFIKELAILLREETSQMPLLNKLGHHIDYAMASVRPKRISRIITGPVFLPHLTKDDNLLQKLLDSQFGSDDCTAASRIIYEYVISENSINPKSLFDPKGRKHEEIQEFAIRCSDEECEKRGVTHVEKFLFAPHSVIQMLGEDYRKEIGHQLIGVGE